MSTDAITTTGLSAMDIKAMRQADHVSFHYHGGQSTIVCTKKVAKAGPFDDQERKYQILCDTEFRCHREDDNGWYDDRKPTGCFEMVYCYESSYFRPVLLLVKPGDELRLCWSANNANGYMRRCSTPEDGRVYRDDLSVVIKRGGKVLCHVLVDVSLCPNNSARMIRFNSCG